MRGGPGRSRERRVVNGVGSTSDLMRGQVLAARGSGASRPKQHGRRTGRARRSWPLEGAAQFQSSLRACYSSCAEVLAARGSGAGDARSRRGQLQQRGQVLAARGSGVEGSQSRLRRSFRARAGPGRSRERRSRGAKSGNVKYGAGRSWPLEGAAPDVRGIKLLHEPARAGPGRSRERRPRAVIRMGARRAVAAGAGAGAQLRGLVVAAGAGAGAMGWQGARTGTASTGARRGRCRRRCRRSVPPAMVDVAPKARRGRSRRRCRRRELLRARPGPRQRRRWRPRSCIASRPATASGGAGACGRARPCRRRRRCRRKEDRARPGRRRCRRTRTGSSGAAAHAGGGAGARRGRTGSLTSWPAEALARGYWRAWRID